MELIYIVTLYPTCKQVGYGGVWGAYSSMEKAQAKVFSWLSRYNEKLIDYITADEGLTQTYITDHGKWVIESVFIDG